MRPTHLLALTLSLVAAVPFAHADDASRRAKAEQMLQLTKTDTLMQEQLSNLQQRVNGMAKEQFGSAQLTPAQQKLTDDYLKQVQGITDQEVGWTVLRPLVIQSYAESFTDADFDAIIAFYKSPAGQAIVAKTPQLAQNTMTTVQAHIKDLQPKLEALTKDYADKMKAAGPAPASSAAPASGGTAPSGSTAAPAKRPAPAATGPAK